MLYMYIGLYHYIFIFHLFDFLVFFAFFIEATLFMPLKCILEIICSVMYHNFIKHVSMFESGKNLGLFAWRYIQILGMQEKSSVLVF